VVKVYKNTTKRTNKNLPTQIELRYLHISIKNRDKAEGILKELLDKNTSIKEFAKYAREYSKDYKTAIKGGYVGKINRDELGNKLFEEIWDSNISYGIYTKILKGPKGFFIPYFLFILRN